MTFTPRDYQLEAAAAFAAHEGTRNGVIVLPTGCHPAGTMILMWDGTTRRVEDVVVGDLLMGPDSTPRRVLQLARGEDEIWEVVPTKGEPWRINPDHILTLYRTAQKPNSPYPSQRQAVLDVTAREWMTWSRTGKHIHKLLRTGVDFQPAAPLEIDPYYLGVLLGDGCLVDGRAITIHKPDSELDAPIRTGAAGVGDAVERRDLESRCPYWVVRGAGTRSALVKLGLSGTRSGDKFIPHAFKTASRHDRLEVLAGLIDTDGHYTCKGYDWISKSRALADDVAYVARSLGLAAYVTPCIKGCQGGFTGEYFRVSISGDCSAIPCRIPRKVAKTRLQKKNHLVTGFTIRECGHREPYFGFALDGDQRYLLADFTVTHNTGKTVTGHLCALPYLQAGNRILWIAHTNELVTQPLVTLNEKFPGYVGGVVQGKRDEAGAQIVYASKDTIKKPERLARLLVHGDFALVVVDECFPAGTLVDGRPIETLAPGDEVWSVHHDDGTLARRKITRVSERVSQEMVTVWCGGRPTTCTPDHPFFVRGRGYVCAKDLVHGDLLCLRVPVRSGAEAGPAGAEVLPEILSGQEVVRQEELFGVWSRVPQGGATLARDVLRCVPGGAAFRGDGQHESEARVKANVGEQPDVAAGSPGVGLPTAEGDRPHTEGSGWEREGPDQVRGAPAGGARRRVGGELHRDDRPAQGERVSGLLQAGPGVPGHDDLRGGGWAEPQHARAQSAGPEEGSVLVWARVDRVQGQEPGGAGGTRVYNLEVEGAHTYFANDILVHNCHHAPAASWKTTVDVLKARGAKILGLTATPERGDAKPLSIDWEIVYSLSIMDAIARGALVPPYVAVDLVKGFDPTQVKITRGEYDAGDLDLHLREHIIKHTVEAIGKVHTWSRLPLHDHDVTTEIKGSIIVYTPTVELGKLTVDALREAGYSAAVVWGEMPTGDRRARLAEFLAGELRILVNACMLVEGTDLPITEAVVIGMPIRKRGRYMQIVGRCVRLFKGKHRGLVLDLCGSSSEHSIVSAPVIISGTDCEVSSDGQHRYSEIHGSREGRCDHCEKVVKCYQSAGPHRFKDGRCSKCGADQCGASPTKEHVYMVVADFTRGCVHCGVEVVDPLSRLAGRESKYKEKVAWKKLTRLPGELYFVHLGRIGLMFNRRTDGGWVPTLVDADGAKPLSRGPVDERIARLLTDDIARRAPVVNGLFGGQKTPTAMKYACLKAEDVAKRLRL